jgi:Holliday junction resolvase
MKDDFDLKKLRKKKSRINSRSKGNTFERQIAKLLNERFDTTEFSRSPGSGAFASTHSLPEHLKIYGDLITPIKFKYCIECKKGYNKIQLNNLLDYSSQFWKFIKQCEKDSEKCDKEPMVIFKQDRQPTLVIININSTLTNGETIKYIEVKDYRIYLLKDALKNWSDDRWFN